MKQAIISGSLRWAGKSSLLGSEGLESESISRQWMSTQTAKSGRQVQFSNLGATVLPKIMMCSARPPGIPTTDCRDQQMPDVTVVVPSYNRDTYVNASFRWTVRK